MGLISDALDLDLCVMFFGHVVVMVVPICKPFSDDFGLIFKSFGTVSWTILKPRLIQICDDFRSISSRFTQCLAPLGLFLVPYFRFLVHFAAFLNQYLDVFECTLG